jgi:sugar phosphate isomerase/epimerase
MIEIGCQTYSLRREEPLAMLASVRKAGFRTIELWVGHADCGADPTSAARLRRAAEDIGLTIQAYAVGGFVRAAVAAVEARLAAAFAYAAELGVDLVTGVIDRRAVTAVDALCRRTGMRFAIENHWYADFARSRDYLDTLRGTSPLLGVTLDTGHLVAAGERPLDAFRRLGARVFDVHLKDVVVAGPLRRLVWRRPRMEGRPIGAGDVGIARLLAALVEGGYGGRLAIEDERHDVPLSELQASRRTCTATLRALGGREPVSEPAAVTAPIPGAVPRL